MKAHLEKYVEYIKNTGGNLLAIAVFDEDWSPTGPAIRREMVAAGLIDEDRGYLLLLSPPET